jgi:hypothetical protein
MAAMGARPKPLGAGRSGIAHQTLERNKRMNAIFSLWSAFANLARAVNRLASVADAVAEEAERRVEVVAYHGKTPAIEAGRDESSNHAEAPRANGRQRKAIATNGQSVG